MAVAIASDITKEMVGEPLFSGVSFKLERKDRMTLSGPNGAGKTTLLRMLAGTSSIDGGELVFGKGVRISLHDQRPPRDKGVKLGDYVFEGCAELLALEARLSKLEEAMAAGATEAATYDAYSRAQAELEHAGGYSWRDGVMATIRGLGFRSDQLDRRLETFSGGELTRASLARALAGDPELLLLDEPTNHLDIAALEWLESYLQNLDAAVVLVAHDRWFLEAVGTSVLEIDGGRGRFFSGTWHAWRKEKAQREVALGRAIEREQAEIDRLERFVARFSAGTRSRQAQSRVKRLDRVKAGSRVGETQPLPGSRKTLEGFTFQPAQRSGRVVFELVDGKLAIGERVLVNDAEFWLERGEHITLIGSNGSGKTTFISTLIGERELDAGKLKTGHNVQIGMLSQHAEELGSGTILEVTQRATGLTPNKARGLLGKFLFSGEAVEKSIDDLSGGERRRVTLAILVSSGANVLILDEPTNHLDIESREALEDALKAFDGTVILITHDRALLDAVGTRTVAIEGQRLNSYLGGWPGYLEARAQRKAADAEADGISAGGRGDRSEQPGKPPAGNGAGTGAASTQGAKSSGGLSKNRQRELAKLESKIEQAELALAKLEDELADPTAWTSGEQTANSAARHAEAKNKVEELYKRWEAIGQ